MTQYNWHLTIYLWDDGENDYYKEPKSSKIFYKYIDLQQIVLGDWCYHTIESSQTIEHIKLPEKIYDINVSYRYWHKEWKRFYMKIFNHDGKNAHITSNIKYPKRKCTEEDLKYGITKKELETEMSDRGSWIDLNQNKIYNLH